METEKQRIEELVKQLNAASAAYYNGQDEIMPNYEWDALFDELTTLEEKTGYIIKDSPTQNAGYEESGSGQKEPHEYPALSLAKTKQVEELQQWAGAYPIWLSWKLDGLTLVLTYDNGNLVKILTRGNGNLGTNITFLKGAIGGFPQKISYQGHLVVRGEAAISYTDFAQINDMIEDDDEKYANPRNLASGTLNLEDPAEVKARHVRFHAFTLVHLDEPMVSWGERMHFLEELSHIFDIVAGEREIDFIVNLEDTEEEVWFSPSKLERILYNLLSNAFKYTQPGGYVKLSAKLIKEEKETFVQISVKDNGRGIPKEAQEQIFESYYQVEKRDHREGFGLGLSLTRSLIHMHKGEIRVESEINKGSDFIVTLNVSEDAYNPDERSSENITTEEIQKYNQRIKETIELIPEKLTNKEKDPARESIMIVEDNKEMNDYLASIFSEKYDIIRAYNGAEACKKIAKQLPNLIISDLMMPVMDGLEFTERVKQDVTTSHIPVILLTAKTDENDHTEGYLRGADAYITKPFNAKNLELLVQNIQKSRKQSIEHFKQAEELNIKQITNNPRDEIFMKELMELIMANLTKEDFGVTEITAHLRISRSLLHMKLKSLTGCSITQFIRTIKMKEAKTHLLNGMNVSEASFAVGISDPNYFTKCFKKEFNITPTEFLKQLK